MHVFEDVLYAVRDGLAVADSKMQASFKCKDLTDGVAHTVEKRAPRFAER